MKDLHQKGFLGISYWVCAACGNQHAGICSANPGQQQDPVSCRVHPVCSCGHQKFRNITPPLRFDGEGTLCDMNKFDDMMLYLSKVCKQGSCGSFLIHNCQMPCRQQPQAAQKRVDESARVDMESSRPEDTAMILGRIDNLDDFNETLRWIVLDEDTGIFANCQGSLQSSDTPRPDREENKLFQQLLVLYRSLCPVLALCVHGSHSLAPSLMQVRDAVLLDASWLNQVVDTRRLGFVLCPARYATRWDWVSA
ncbi:unnamed protein product [Prorocentrum cordatum]|uniref:Uncharacterized protein n=1 Tax=Prorocentrum cordatum TaxID=2364126 RepID=A0ABN9UVE8_9DINO|nr:unnamed protein product [Polarella glacialis]